MAKSIRQNEKCIDGRNRRTESVPTANSDANLMPKRELDWLAATRCTASRGCDDSKSKYSSCENCRESLKPKKPAPRRSH